MSDGDAPAHSRLEILQLDLLRNIWPFIGSTTEVLLACSAVSPRLRMALDASLETFAVDFFGRSMGKWERAKGSGGMADYRSGLSGSGITWTPPGHSKALKDLCCKSCSRD